VDDPHHQGVEVLVVRPGVAVKHVDLDGWSQVYLVADAGHDSALACRGRVAVVGLGAVGLAVVEPRDHLGM